MANHFFKKFIQIFYFLPFTTLLPLVFEPRMYLDCRVWIATMTGVVFHLFAPYTPPSDIINSKETDRMSTRFLLLVCCLIYMISLIEYGYFTIHSTVRSVSVVVGLAIATLGLLLRLWATKTLGSFFTATIQLTPDQPIIDLGPYKYLRHPAYLSSMIVALSIPITLHSYCGFMFFWICFIPAYIYRIKVEEEALITKFGNAYAEKMRHTWKLIPFVY